MGVIGYDLLSHGYGGLGHPSFRWYLHVVVRPLVDPPVVLLPEEHLIFKVDKSETLHCSVKIIHKQFQVPAAGAIMNATAHKTNATTKSNFILINENVWK